MSKGVYSALSAATQEGQGKTAFVLAGGGSFGAIQVGMMHALAANGVSADMVVGSSVGAINGAYYAGAPTLKGVLELETIWRGLRRRDVCPVTWRTLFGFVWAAGFPHSSRWHSQADRRPHALPQFAGRRAPGPYRHHRYRHG